MFRSPSVAGCWTALVDRLDGAGVMAGWAAAEPELAGVVTVGELPSCVAPSAGRERADAVLGALVRLAAADGGNDQNAVLVLLHLLSDGACALAARLSDVADDILLLVVGQLTVQIRTFPWRRRTRAYAANLLLDTKAALWRELRPDRRRGGQRREVLVDPLDYRQVFDLLDRPVPDDDPDEVRLADVLVWASRNQVAAGEDLALLGELGHRHLTRPADRERSLDRPGREIATQEDLARRLGVTERTLRRRRDRALAALSEASQDYLRAVA